VDKTELAISEIWVCWVKPEAWPAGDTPILSFLSPAVEEKLERTHGGPVILAREASRSRTIILHYPCLDLLLRIIILKVV